MEGEAQNRTIDVSVATLNSVKTVGKSLNSIKVHIPHGRIVVVDSGSKDGTARLAEQMGAEVAIERGYLGKIRYKQAELCKGEWMAYVDSDVYIYSKWWEYVSRHMDKPDVGMVLGFCDAPLSKLKIYEAYLKYMARKYGSIAFSNTLIRRRLVLECKGLLDKVHGGEDGIVGQHILKKGMKIVTIPIPLCFHDKDPYRGHPNAFYRWGQSVRLKFGFVDGFKPTVRTIVKHLLNWLRFTKETKELSILLLFFFFYLSGWMMVGYLRGVKR